jgi:hypothetical protein
VVLVEAVVVLMMVVILPLLLQLLLLLHSKVIATITKVITDLCTRFSQPLHKQYHKWHQLLQQDTPAIDSSNGAQHAALRVRYISHCCCIHYASVAGALSCCGKAESWDKQMAVTEWW